MKNLLNIFKGKDKPEIKNTLSADEIKPIFEAVGIDIEKIGFPVINTRHMEPLERYIVRFEDVNIKPVKINEKPSIIITGKYRDRAMASYQDSEGSWHPGGTSHYTFKIQDGELNIKRKNK
jgi:hypothetical protein